MILVLRDVVELSRSLFLAAPFATNLFSPDDLRGDVF